MKKSYGTVEAISGNMISVLCEGTIMQNEVGFVLVRDERLRAEVIRVRDNTAYMQVFESTQGLKVGDRLEFSGEMLSVELGPGLLGQVFDGLQNSLPMLAEKSGYFLRRVEHREALNPDFNLHFTPAVKMKDKVFAGMPLGSVPEGIFSHYIMVPFYLNGIFTVVEAAKEGDYGVKDVVCRLEGEDKEIVEVRMVFHWPVKIPISAYAQKYLPKESLTTQNRIIDPFFPIAKGGTY